MLTNKIMEANIINKKHPIMEKISKKPGSREINLPTGNRCEPDNGPAGRIVGSAGGRTVLWVGMVIGLLLLLGAVFWALLLGRSSSVPVTAEQLMGLVPESITRIMIVAHPDDETFWGGAHLAAEPYFVVCMTCGDNEVRKHEFEQAVRLAGSVPLILEYPDKEFGIRSRWTGYLDDIAGDLAVLLAFKDWEAVVTHNPYGEYGHIHHKRTSSMVTRAAEYCPGASLYYFGIYDTPKQLEAAERSLSLPPRQPDSMMEIKRQMIALYQSQVKAEEEFCHMFPFEDWYCARPSFAE